MCKTQGIVTSNAGSATPLAIKPTPTGTAIVLIAVAKIVAVPTPVVTMPPVVAYVSLAFFTAAC